MIELREYQKDLLSRVQSKLQPDKARVMMQLPTGGGKTVIAAHLLKSWLAHGRNAVWLTHRKELVNQTRKMLSDTGIAVYPGHGWGRGTPAPMIHGGVVILMAQTVSRRIIKAGVWRNYDDADLMIIDEAHHATAKGWELAIRRFPGKAVGMTATPWRLSQKEGFDRLFKDLVRGPDVPDLQDSDFLCNAKVLIPSLEQRIQGGKIGGMGDYTETGIERANQENINIMTAGVLEFWKNHARDRQTIIYAVSKRHAGNLASLFASAGIPAGTMLSDTPQQTRDAMIAKFGDGELRTLINVAVATEGFDLPDASCVVIARPTQSLALYLQMVGRGLRPKPNGGDCLVLDLAGNAITHGLPERRREWSLTPRGQPPEGEAPVVWCEHCGAVSPAASQSCQSCGAPFGEDCQRCGKWRAFSRWLLIKDCPHIHDVVCDFCHRDAHIQNHLPVTAQMEALAELDDEGRPNSRFNLQSEDAEMTIHDNELDSRLASVLKDLLEEEHQRMTSETEYRRRDLREFIAMGELALSDKSVLDERFEEHLDTLPGSERPITPGQIGRLYPRWESSLKRELADKRNELTRLETQPIDKEAVFNSVRDRTLSVLKRESENDGIFRFGARDSSKIKSPSPSFPDTGWLSLADTDFDPAGRVPSLLKFQSGEEIAVDTWTDFLAEVANLLIRDGKLSRENCPVSLGRARRYLINATPHHSDGTRFVNRRELLSGMYINTHYGAKNIISNSRNLLSAFGQDPSQLHIKLK